MALVACPVSAIGTAARRPSGEMAAASRAFPELVAEADGTAVHHCGWASRRSYGAASWLVVRAGGNVLVDSPRYAPRLAERIRELGGARFLFLTHRDDVADHQRWADVLGCERILHAKDVSRATASVERRIEGKAPRARAVPDMALARPLLRSIVVPRIPRAYLVEENSTNHCTWRSHGHALVLDSEAARQKFLALLRKYKDKYGIQIHSFCLMGTHPHVMCKSTKGQPAFSAFWKVVNWGFARWYNRRTGGRGQVVMERLRSPQIQSGRHQLLVMRYGDMNPVRARLARSAKDWRWSSHRHYAYGEKNDLIADAPEYLTLGATAARRRKAYLHLFAEPLVDAFLSRRPELVDAPFIGEPAWLAARLDACGLSPPT